MAVKDEILALRNERGFYHPPTILRWAKEHPNSALHGAIEWDDTRAAHEFRLDQVRSLIHIYVVDADRTPILYSLSIDRVEGNGYRHRDDIAKVPTLRDTLLQDALNELERVQKKYQMIKELNEVWSSVDKAKSSVKRRGRKPRRPDQPDARA